MSYYLTKQDSFHCLHLLFSILYNLHQLDVDERDLSIAKISPFYPKWREDKETI